MSAQKESETFKYSTFLDGANYRLSTVMDRSEMRLTIFMPHGIERHAVISISEARALRDWLNGVFT